MQYCGTSARLQEASPTDGVVVAIINDITLMGSLDAVVNMEAARDELQKNPNYLINLSK